MAEIGQTARITLIKSLSGRFKKHVSTAKSLGLKKRCQSVVQKVNECVLGKIKKISYLIEVEYN
ncbi:MAG: 50S ribosomal protein L30 [Candidatus Improbicoccus devescovinae]|nr:MAG: 50S ribosomal protein L30 [Candidatus Improbicoccus devescovinae]